MLLFIKTKMPGECLLFLEQTLIRREASATFMTESHAAPRREQEFAKSAPTLLDVVLRCKASDAKCNEATAKCILYCCCLQGKVPAELSPPL